MPPESWATSLGAFLAALIAFLAPGAAVLGASVLVASEGGEQVTGGEWVTCCVAAIVASAAGEARAARRVTAEARRGEATALRLVHDGRPPEAGSSV